MAFVFRSQNKTSNLPQQQPVDPPSTEQASAKNSQPGTIRKGLPHIHQKQQIGDQKENPWPDFEARPIHKAGTLSFNTTVFKSRDFNDERLNKIPSENSTNIKQVLTVKEIFQGKISDQSLISQNQGNSSFNSQSAKILGTIKEEKPAIINKNLLKTMIHMSQKLKEKLQIQKILVSESKQAEKSRKGSKFKDWKSLKKLSPLRNHKDLSKIDQTAQTQDLNISCSALKLSKEDSFGAFKLQKEDQVKLPSNFKKAQKIRNQSPFNNNQQSSEEENEYLPEATPGPGAYSYQDPDKKKQFRSKRKKFQKIFYSQIERFQDHAKKFQQVTYLNDEITQKDTLNKSSSACQSFLSKSPKFQQPQECIKPPPGYYDTRQTLEHDLVRNILKSSNTITFINRSPRIYKVQGQSLPGPGAYTLDKSLQKLIQEKGTLSYAYKSQLERKLEHCLKENEGQKTGASDLINEIGPGPVIHVKDSILQNYYISEPPAFLSSTERFPSLKLPPKQRYLPKERQKIPIPSPPKEPFNSSQKREVIKKVGEGVGIGLYNLNKDKWSKKSFNVLFN